MQFLISQNILQNTVSVCASVYTGHWSRLTPNVDKCENSHPHNVDKMPIQDGQIQHVCPSRRHCFQVQQADSQVQEAHNNVEAVKSGRQEELASKDGITEGVRCITILQILIKAKQSSQRNSINQHISRFSTVPYFHCVFTVVLTKVRSSQQHCVQSRASSPINRHYSYWRPSHPNPYCRHQSLMQEPPKQTYKKHLLTNNKQNHSQIQPIFYFSSMATINAFTNNVTPPQALSISQKDQRTKQYASSKSILVEIQNQANCQCQHTQRSILRPRTSIKNMKRMVLNRTATLKFFRVRLVNFHVQTFGSIATTGKHTQKLEKFKHIKQK